MNRWNNLLVGMKGLLHKQQIARELDEELEGYLEDSARHKQSMGMSYEAARRAALVEVGSRDAVKHQIWASRWEASLEGFLRDIRLSLRTLGKSPLYAFIALLSLSLGIGANTAIFTLIEQVMLRNLPVKNPDQLVTFGNETGGGEAGGINMGAYGLFPWYFARQLQMEPGPFQGIASFCSFSDKVSIRLPGGPSGANAPALLAPANLVSGNYFSVLGAEPFLGRAITPFDDAVAGDGAVVVVSHHFWQQSLGSDPSVLGKTISINGTPFVVIGVMPQGFHGIKRELEPPDLWAPMTMQATVLMQPSMLTPVGGLYFLDVFGRLSSQAASNRSALLESQNWLNQQIRNGIRAEEGGKATPARLQEISRVTTPLVYAARGASSLRDQYSDSLKILMGVVAFVLLIACANLANFLLARAASREREIATRLALGSSRGRIVRQSLIETLLLSLTGGVLGLGLAFLATRVLIGFVSQGSAYIAMDPSPNITVLLFTLGLSLCTALLFGLAPALTAARIGVTSNLGARNRTTQSSGGKSKRFWPKTLVCAQVMLCLLLLVGAGLFLRTLRNLQSQDFGFERSHLLLADFNARLAGYKPSQTPQLHQSLIDRISALPGVRSVALAATAPISAGNWSSTVTVPGYTTTSKENNQSLLNRVSGQYFETAGIAMVAGRSITNADTANSLKVAVINQTLARHFFPKGDAVGRSILVDISDVKGPWQIVGIARDTRSGDPRTTDPVQMTYLPLSQIDPFLAADASTPAAPGTAAAPVSREENQDRFANLILVRTSDDPAHTINDLRAAVASIDPNLPLLKITTMHDQMSSFMTHDELISSLTGLFSLLALLLAAIGLYGVMSYNVVRRTNEIGIRLALGAQAQALRWMILRESLLLVGIGVALGLPSALAAAWMLRHQLFGLRLIDPGIFVSALTVVVGMGVLAAWMPARNASRVNPTTALRYD